MNKRGQVYLLMALVIGAIVFNLVIKSNIIERETLEGNFERLYDNYEHESSKFVNVLLSERKDASVIAGEFVKFSRDFGIYSKTENIKFESFYVFAYENKLFAFNYLNIPVTIESGSLPGGEQTLQGCGEELTASLTFKGITVATDMVLADIKNEGCISPIDPMRENLWPAPTSGMIILEIIGKNKEELRYSVELEKNKPEIVIFSKEEEDEQRKVFYKGIHSGTERTSKNT